MLTVVVVNRTFTSGRGGGGVDMCARLFIDQQCVKSYVYMLNCSSLKQCNIFNAKFPDLRYSVAMAIIKVDISSY